MHRVIAFTTGVLLFHGLAHADYVVVFSGVVIVLALVAPIFTLNN